MRQTFILCRAASASSSASSTSAPSAASKDNEESEHIAASTLSLARICAYVYTYLDMRQVQLQVDMHNHVQSCVYVCICAHTHAHRRTHIIYRCRIQHPKSRNSCTAYATCIQMQTQIHTIPLYLRRCQRKWPGWARCRRPRAHQQAGVAAAPTGRCL